jgi:golgi to ER traffic protein 4
VKAIKWSRRFTEYKIGHPSLHRQIAEIMWKEGNLEHSKHHYLLSKDGEGCGKMLIEYSDKGKSER